MPSHYLLTACLLSVCDHVVLSYVVRCICCTHRTLYVIHHTCHTSYVVRCTLYHCTVMRLHRCTVALTLMKVCLISSATNSTCRSLSPVLWGFASGLYCDQLLIALIISTIRGLTRVLLVVSAPFFKSSISVLISSAVAAMYLILSSKTFNCVFFIYIEFGPKFVPHGVPNATLARILASVLMSWKTWSLRYNLDYTAYLLLLLQAISLHPASALRTFCTLVQYWCMQEACL